MSTDNDVARHVPTLDGADTSLLSEDLPFVLPGIAKGDLESAIGFLANQAAEERMGYAAARATNRPIGMRESM